MITMPLRENRAGKILIPQRQWRALLICTCDMKFNVSHNSFKFQSWPFQRGKNSINPDPVCKYVSRLIVI